MFLKILIDKNDLYIYIYMFHVNKKNLSINKTI